MKISSLKIVAGTTASATADPCEAFFKQHDPALRAINEHRQAAKIHDAAVKIQFASEGKVTKAAYTRLRDTTSEACEDLFSSARPLVTTQPTTQLGAIALLQYFASLFDDEGGGLDCTNMPDDIDGEGVAGPRLSHLGGVACEGAAMNVVKFPYRASRRVHSRKPRRSINGTPEERAAKAPADGSSRPTRNAGMKNHRLANNPK